MESLEASYLVIWLIMQSCGRQLINLKEGHQNMHDFMANYLSLFMVLS